MTQIYSQLEIIRGLKSDALHPGDTNTAEQVYETLNLLGGVYGISTTKWTPKYPALKNGGTFAESPVTNGARLIASAYANPTESMTVVVSSLNYATRADLLSKLMRLGREADAFWTGAAIEPVYLGWKLETAKVPQFARLITIEIAGQGDIHNLLAAWEFTVTMMREPEWQILVPPGGNPKMWSFYAADNDVTPGVDYDYTDLQLWDGTDHLLTETVTNKFEWNPTTYQAALSKNYVDIPAASIPGDAPALVCIIAHKDTDAYLPDQLYVAHTVTPTSYHTLDNETLQQFNTFAAGDGASALMTKTIDTCGVYSNGSSTNKYMASYAVPVGPDANFREDVLRWSPGGFSANLNWSMNQLRGRYAVYLRAKQTAGTDGDIQVRLVVGYGLYNQLELAPATIPPLTPSASCGNEWNIIYLGSVQIPLNAKANSGIRGRGLNIWEAGDGLSFELQTKNTTASIRTVEILDLILMPMDYAFAHIPLRSDTNIALSNANTFILDNTGYIMHGEPGEIAVQGNSDPGSSAGNDLSMQELRGRLPELIPGQNNRLYFLLSNAQYTAGAFVSRFSLPETTLDVRINLIPRCYGLASV